MSLYAVAAIITGCFWGTTGLFARLLSDAGFTSLQLLFVRCLVATFFFGVMILIKNPKLFCIKLKDLPLFLAVGIAGQFLFSFFYYTAIGMMSISTACILLYLSPALVAILSRFIFKDKMGKRGVLAVILCVLGCACVSGFGGTVTALGVVFALGAAISFALINIIDRAILSRGYTGLTVNFYIALIAALTAAIFVGVKQPMTLMFATGKTALISILNGLVTGFLPFLCFSYALSGCESGKVSILASTEPVMAALLSILVFKEPFGIWSVIGIILVLGSIVLMNTKSKEERLKA